MHQGNGINPIFPFQMDENGLPYNTDGLTQLQPFQAPVNYNTGGYNFNMNNPAIPLPELNSWQQQQQQQNLQTSVNCRFLHPEDGVITNNTGHMSMGLGLNSHNNSIGNDCGSIKAPQGPQPHLFFINDTIRRVFDRHSEELDTFFTTRAIDLKNSINQLLQKQKASIANTMKMGMLQRLQAKDVEIMKLNQRNMELEERIKQLTIENESWQTRANHNESLIFTMKSQLEQGFMYHNHQMEAKEGHGDNTKLDDASSSNNHRHFNYCRNCGFGEINVLLLPCRHLCLCEQCDGILSVCPVCRVTINSSLKVLAH